MELIKCAIIENDVVVNIAVVESLEKAIELFGGEVLLVNDDRLFIGATRDLWETPVIEENVSEEPTE